METRVRLNVERRHTSRCVLGQESRRAVERSSSFAFHRRAPRTRRTHWFSRYVTQAIDHEHSPNLRARVGRIPEIPGSTRGTRVEKTGMGILYRARARTFLCSTYGKNFRVDCLVFRISERPELSFSGTYNVLLSRFVDTDVTVTKNSDTKERYLVGDESVTRSKSTGADRIYSRERKKTRLSIDTAEKCRYLLYIITLYVHTIICLTRLYC